MNAGSLPASDWHQDPSVGGGRLLGEACHFIDLVAFLAESKIRRIASIGIGEKNQTRDTVAIMMELHDGSIGTVNYLSNGSRSYPKENISIFCGGKVIDIQNFRKTKGYGYGVNKTHRTFQQDKGHKKEISQFIKSVSEDGSPITPFDELVNISKASLAAVKGNKTGNFENI